MQVDCDVGRPKVNFREAIQDKAEFNYLHKKQSGGSGASVAPMHIIHVCLLRQCPWPGFLSMCGHVQCHAVALMLASGAQTHIQWMLCVC